MGSLLAGVFTGILFDTLLWSKIRRGNHEYLRTRSDMQKEIYCTIEILPGDINLPDSIIPV